MTISRVGTPSFVTQAGTSLSQSMTSAGDADLYFLVTQRGGSGSPTSVTYKSVTATAAGGLFQITGSSRFGRWYRIARASAPSSGSGTMAVSWAGVDNIGVGLVEYRGDAGELSVTANTEISNGSTPLTFTISALTGDVTLAGCMGNSAAPAFTPTSGQTEFLESAWYSNTGHVVGELFGASSSIAWTASGSTCGGALVIHETAGGAIAGNADMALAGSATLSGSGALAAASTLTLTQAGTLTGAGALASGIALALTASGTLAGSGALTGDAPLTLALSGTMAGAGALSGNADQSLFLSGTVTATGALSGAAGQVLTLTGTLAGTGILSGDAPLVLDVTGTLSLPPGGMQGDATLELAVSGALTGSGALSGASSLNLDGDGTLTGLGALAGSAGMALELSGTLAAPGLMVGNAALVLAASGTMTGSAVLTGNANLALSLSGIIRGAPQIARLTATLSPIQPGISATLSTVQPGVSATIGEP